MQIICLKKKQNKTTKKKGGKKPPLVRVESQTFHGEVNA